jgi:hypothetical protein
MKDRTKHPNILPLQGSDTLAAAPEAWLGLGTLRTREKCEVAEKNQESQNTPHRTIDTTRLCPLEGDAVDHSSEGDL